jgi:hypothetical protein
MELTRSCPTEVRTIDNPVALKMPADDVFTVGEVRGAGLLATVRKFDNLHPHCKTEINGRRVSQQRNWPPESDRADA